MRNREGNRKFGGQSGVIVMNTSDRSKEVGKNRRKELLVEFVHKHCCDKLTRSRNLIIFRDLKIGLECSMNEAKVIMRIARFCRRNKGLILDS